MSNWVLPTLIGAVIGSIVIYLFYTAVRTRWPSNYASSANDFGMVVNRTVFRYAVFALGPTYVVALLVGTTVSRSGGAGLVTAFLIGIFRVGCYYYVRSVYRTIRHNHTATRTPTIILDVAISVCVLIAATLGGLGPGRFGFLVPPIEEFFRSLWGTVFVAILAAIVIAKTNVQFNVSRLVRRSRREVGPELLELVRKEAREAGVDATLAETVVLTENLQRPKWFRSFEVSPLTYAGGHS
jgi:cell shape-determining protein MreD